MTEKEEQLVNAEILDQFLNLDLGAEKQKKIQKKSFQRNKHNPPRKAMKRQIRFWEKIKI